MGGRGEISGVRGGAGAPGKVQPKGPGEREGWKGDLGVAAPGGWGCSWRPLTSLLLSSRHRPLLSLL